MSSLVSRLYEMEATGIRRSNYYLIALLQRELVPTDESFCCRAKVVLRVVACLQEISAENSTHNPTYAQQGRHPQLLERLLVVELLPQLSDLAGSVVHPRPVEGGRHDDKREQHEGIDRLGKHEMTVLNATTSVPSNSFWRHRRNRRRWAASLNTSRSHSTTSSSDVVLNIRTTRSRMFGIKLLLRRLTSSSMKRKRLWSQPLRADGHSHLVADTIGRSKTSHRVCVAFNIWRLP